MVAIIGLLSSIVLASLNSARMKGRNTARLSSIHTLTNAFFLSLGQNGSFPVLTPAPSIACISTNCYGIFATYDDSYSLSQKSKNDAMYGFLAPNLPQKPSDPGGSNCPGILYIPNSSNVARLFYYLESSPGSCGSIKILYISIDKFKKIDLTNDS